MRSKTIQGVRFSAGCWRAWLVLVVGLATGFARGADVLDHWTKRSPEVVNRVEFAGGVFFGFPGGGKLMTSTNGADWASRTNGNAALLTSVAYGGPLGARRYVGLGSGGTILVSTNAIDWTQVPSPVTTPLNGIAAAGSRFCIVTSQGTTSDPQTLFSFDGEFWMPSAFPEFDLVNLPIPPLGQPYHAYWVLAVSDTFLAGGSSSIVQNVWRYTGALGGWRATSTGTVYVDGAEGNGRIVVLDYYGGAVVSKNLGSNWTSHTATNIGGNDPIFKGFGHCLTFGNGVFVGGSGRGLITSLDGETWELRSAFTNTWIHDVAYGHGRFVVATRDGIYQSAGVSKPYIDAKMIPDEDKVRLTVSGEVGRPYRLQISTNLSTWTDRSRFTNTTFSADLTNNVGAGTNQLFFRVVSP